jgi:lipoate-protein ligase A
MGTMISAPRYISSTSSKIRLSWLDLRTAGLSILERLSVEEALLRHDPKNRSWVIVGTHTPCEHKYLSQDKLRLPDYIQNERTVNSDCMIVMGIGGRPEKLLDIPKVQQDQVLVVKRFSGGGTVALDINSVWTTIIGRNQDFVPTLGVDPYPRSIMQWTADSIFAPTFDKLISQKGSSMYQQKTLALDTKSCSATENGGKIVSLPASEEQDIEILKFALRENDYVLGENLKMGGNAQSIVKDGWLHHTSFLWDYDLENMSYLTLPEKRPDYRKSRSHDEFLTSLGSFFGRSHGPFISSLRETCNETALVERVTLTEVMEEVIDGELGGMEQWFEKNRTRILLEL